MNRLVGVFGSDLEHALILLDIPEGQKLLVIFTAEDRYPLADVSKKCADDPSYKAIARANKASSYRFNRHCGGHGRRQECAGDKGRKFSFVALNPFIKGCMSNEIESGLISGFESQKAVECYFPRDIHPCVVGEQFLDLCKNP